MKAQLLADAYLERMPVALFGITFIPQYKGVVCPKLNIMSTKSE